VFIFWDPFSLSGWLVALPDGEDDLKMCQSNFAKGPAKHVVSLSKGISWFALHEIVLFRRSLFAPGLSYPGTRE
jgi:hypothetical protein